MVSDELGQGTSTDGEVRDDRRYSRLLDESIAAVLGQAVWIVASRPSLLAFGVRAMLHQRKAAARRRELATGGLQVPAVMILSVTNRCNLSCRRCYLKAQGRRPGPEMTRDELGRIAGQAVDLGISFLIFAGGEPLVRKDEILSLAGEYPWILFGVITNGLLIDGAMARRLASLRNVVPVLSFEGFREETDARRGEGVFGRLVETCSLLEDAGVFFGCSLTVTRENHALVTGEAFVRELIGAGCRVFAFVEYVPVQEGTEGLVLTGEQRRSLVGCLRTYPGKFPAVFLGFPGDEEAFGGCLASGRGFVHVSAAGDLEPCPAAPFSDANLTRMPLKEALASPFLARIRAHHDRLTEAKGGCALWTNREWTASVLREGRGDGPTGTGG